jgi:hypothetical protein
MNCELMLGTDGRMDRGKKVYPLRCIIIFVTRIQKFEIHDVQKSTTSIGCQINMKKKQRSKYCQANVGSRSAKLEQSVNMKTIGSPHEISQAWGLPLNSMTVIMNAIKKIYNLHFTK